MELSPGLVELDVPVEEDGEVGKDIHTRPVYIAAVDLSGEERSEVIWDKVDSKQPGIRRSVGLYGGPQMNWSDDS